MTYDPIDTNNDGVVDADVDNQSVTSTRREVDETSTELYLSSSQSVADGSITKIEFDADDGDDWGAFDAANHEFVVPSEAEGDWLVVANIVWDSDSGWSDGDLASTIVRVNGSAQMDIPFRKQSTSDQSGSNPTTVLKSLTAGDTITVATFLNASDGNPKPIKTGSDRTNCAIHYLG